MLKLHPAQVTPMKFNQLRSIGHNIADSLASSVGLLVDEYDFHVFEEAHNSSEQYLEVDFLTGTIFGATPSPKLARVVGKYAAALPDLCRREGVSVSDFRCLRARFDGGGWTKVAVEDHKGRRAVDDYYGIPAARPRELGPHVEIRKKRVPVIRVEANG